MALVVAVPAVDAFAIKGKIYPGVRVGSLELGGATYEEARASLAEHADSFLKQSLIITRESKQTSIPLSTLVTFDIDATVAQAQEIGHTGNTFLKLKERVTARAKGATVNAAVTVNTDALQSLVTQAFPEAHAPAKNAAFVFVPAVVFLDQAPVLTIEDESSGIAIDFEAAALAIENQARVFENSPIELATIPSVSPVTRIQLLPLLPLAQELFKKPPPIVTFEARTWVIPYTTLASWLTVEDGGAQGPSLQLDREKIIAWLNIIAKEIEKAPVSAIFERTPDGKKIGKFSLGAPGVALPREKNAASLASALLNGQPLSLSVVSSAPVTSITSEAETLGIKELVGRGVTQFAGSPANRIKNIKRGAELLNGTLIAPGEEFSILEHLRPFTLENKYVPGLVIKAAEGKTEPEIGGGLCQIGTTLFRTVLNAGLPVTARSNHSYRVGYYEPPVGMDATIYDPQPDFKFLNDTGHWLLLTTRIEGITATFELWGTKDGRTVSLSKPETSNIRQPAPKKIIETLDLAPGKITCTEKAHVGSDARFTSTVTYADGHIVEKEFKSRYQPWQEVCLLGVEAVSPPDTAASPPSSTSTSNSQTLPSADEAGVTGNGNPAPFIAN